MKSSEILIDGFSRVQEQVHAVLGGIDEKALTARPSDTANSIAWLIWHLTRIQDDHLADAAGHEQVHTADGWHARLGLPFDAADTGYDHSSEQVGQVVLSAELLRGYYDAVHARTLDFLRLLTEPELDRIVDTRWNPPVTLAVRLVSVLDDDLEHIGQAAYVKGLVS
ncbi:DinB family protein [Kribbella sandramycini]|uniref:DinB family protein n=1 Tax=Kribbella sandramycini TaxID=60450 RepID=A0A7Y4NXX2_9ACTN|nr:DinB family protein [Kribbella sandramycini]MBB6568193.1 putative damage-inducible protein DinB [Kribbella sandramycini]NOL39213.1 DinB family protein [Kribbella sandramycini]